MQKPRLLSLGLYGLPEIPAEFSEVEPSLIGTKQAIAPLPRLILTPNVYRRLVCWLEATPHEFQAMGIVEQTMRGLEVTHVFVPPHQAGHTRTRLHQENYPDFLDRIARDGHDLNKLRLQVHSHGQMSSFFSAKDVDTIRRAYRCDWMISLVGNVQREMCARLDVFRPIPLSINLPISVDLPIESGEATEWLAELKTAMQFVDEIEPLGNESVRLSLDILKPAPAAAIPDELPTKPVGPESERWPTS